MYKLSFAGAIEKYGNQRTQIFYENYYSRI